MGLLGELGAPSALRGVVSRLRESGFCADAEFGAVVADTFLERSKKSSNGRMTRMYEFLI